MLHLSDMHALTGGELTSNKQWFDVISQVGPSLSIRPTCMRVHDLHVLLETNPWCHSGIIGTPQNFTLTLKGIRLENVPNPTYAGVILETTLFFKEHLKGLSAKLKSSQQNRSTSTLQTQALAFAYLAAQHCDPVWSRSPHRHQLNTAIQIITGTTCSKPTNPKG